MFGRTLLATTVLLAACDESGSIATPESLQTSPSETPGLDLNLTQGYTAAEHTEVAPGVFMLTDLYESGEVTYVPATFDLAADATEAELQAAIAMSGPRMPTAGGGAASSCYNYDYQYYNEQIDKSLFPGRATLYGYANAYSYSYNNGRTSGNAIYAGAYTYAQKKMDYAYAYAYVYIEGRYIGYAHQYVQDGTYAYAYGSWEARCDSDLTIDATVYLNNYFYMDDGTSVSVSKTYETSAACCL